MTMSNASASLLHNGTANAMLTTTNTTADFNYAGVVFSRVCPGNNQADIIRASKSHMNPYQLLFLACLTVAGFRLLPELKKLFRRAELCFCDLNGDGKVDEKDIDVSLKKCCRGGGGCRKPQAKKQKGAIVVPAAAAAVKTYRCSGLTALPASIGNLVKLQTLNLEGCSGLTALPASVLALQKQGKLTIKGRDDLQK